MNYRKKLIAAGCMTGILAVATAATYYGLAGTWNAIPLKSWPKHPISQQQQWIAEIAEEYNCEPKEFMPNLRETTFNCPEDMNAFQLQDLKNAINTNLTFHTGKIHNSKQSAGEMMLLLSGPFIVSLLAGGLGEFGILFGLMVLWDYLHISDRIGAMANRVSSTTSTILGRLGCYNRQVDEVTVVNDIEEGVQQDEISVTTPSTGPIVEEQPESTEEKSIVAPQASSTQTEEDEHVVSGPAMMQ